METIILIALSTYHVSWYTQSRLDDPETEYIITEIAQSHTYGILHTPYSIRRRSDYIIG